MRKLFKTWQAHRRLKHSMKELDKFTDSLKVEVAKDILIRLDRLEKGRDLDSEHFTTFLDRHQERIEALEVVTGLHHD